MPCVYPPEWPDYKRILGGIHEGVTADLKPPPTTELKVFE